MVGGTIITLWIFVQPPRLSEFEKLAIIYGIDQDADDQVADWSREGNMNKFDFMIHRLLGR